MPSMSRKPRVLTGEKGGVMDISEVCGGKGRMESARSLEEMGSDTLTQGPADMTADDMITEHLKRARPHMLTYL